jgi:hypothetical protein
MAGFAIGGLVFEFLIHLFLLLLPFILLLLTSFLLLFVVFLFVVFLLLIVRIGIFCNAAPKGGLGVGDMAGGAWEAASALRRVDKLLFRRAPYFAFTGPTLVATLQVAKNESWLHKGGIPGRD